MATKMPAAVGIVDPTLVYTLERLAVTLGVTARYAREEWINSGRLAAMPMGRTYLVHGETFALFVCENLEQPARRRDNAPAGEM